MRFVRYDGDELGMLTPDGHGVIDLTGPLGLSSSDPLREYIVGGYDASEHAHDEPACDVDEVTLEAPIRRPGKIVAAPRNYRAHAQEMGTGDVAYAQAYFLKAPSSISGPEDGIQLPFSDRRCDHEIELAAVVGRDVVDVDADDALDAVFGFTILLDVSIRGDRDRSNRKSYDTFAPIGPAVVTTDEFDDPYDLQMELRVNGEVRQRANTGEMVFTCEEIVQYASISSTIRAGDIVATGTPEGVGRLRDGDVVEAEIEGIGSMSLVCRERDDRFGDRVLPPR